MDMPQGAADVGEERLNLGRSGVPRSGRIGHRLIHHVSVVGTRIGDAADGSRPPADLDLERLRVATGKRPHRIVAPDVPPARDDLLFLFDGTAADADACVDAAGVLPAALRPDADPRCR